MSAAVLVAILLAVFVAIFLPVMSGYHWKAAQDKARAHAVSLAQG